MKILLDHQIRVCKDPHAEIVYLQESGFVPHGRKEISPVPFSLPFDWHSDPLKDKNWMFQLHAWRMLDPYLNFLASENRSAEVGEDVGSIIFDWFQNNVVKTSGVWSWYDMSTGIRASKLAFLKRVGGAEHLRWQGEDWFMELVSCHFDNLMDPASLNSGNHGLFQLWGLMSLSMAFPEHQSSEIASAYAARSMAQLVARQLGEHGVHTENSPAYHFFAVSQISRILSTPDWDLDELTFVRRKLDNAEKVKPWLVDPMGRMVPVGDSTQGKVDTSKLEPLEALASKSSGSEIGCALDGYAVVRSFSEVPSNDASFVFFTASFHSATHKHSDCLSFIWQESGQDILIDSGKYGYSRGAFRKYFLSTHAHNTLQFNGRSTARSNADAYGSGIRRLEVRDGVWFIDGTVSHESSHYTHSRRLVFWPGKALVVLDHVVPSGPRLQEANDYCVFWHLAPGAAVDLLPEGFQARVSEKLPMLQVRQVHNADNMRIRLFEGVNGEALQGWVSTGYLRAEPAPVVGFQSRVKHNYVSVTTLTMSGHDSPWSNRDRGVNDQEFLLDGWGRQQSVDTRRLLGP